MAKSERASLDIWPTTNGWSWLVYVDGDPPQEIKGSEGTLRTLAEAAEDAAKWVRGYNGPDMPHSNDIQAQAAALAAVSADDSADEPADIRVPGDPFGS